MADKWTGGLTAVAQVDHCTPGGTIEADDVFNITLENIYQQSSTITYTGSTTVKLVSEGLVAAAAVASAAGTAPWNEVTVTEDDTKVIITANTAGNPFTCTVETTETGGGAADDQTFVRAASVANVGTGMYGNANSWYSGVAPAANGDVIMPAGSAYDITGSDESAVELDTFVVETGCTKAIGGKHANGSIAWLRIDIAETIELGGTGNVYLDYGTSATPTTLLVTNAGAAASAGLYNVNLKGTLDTSMTVNVPTTGKVGLATETGDSATAPTINLHAGSLTLGEGVTNTATNQYGGTMYSESDLPTVDQYGGTLYIEGAATVATAMTIRGTVYYSSTGTITPAVSIYSGGVLDFSKGTGNVTVTGVIQLYKGSSLIDPDGRMNSGNAVYKCVGCTESDVTISLPPNKTHTLS